LIVPVVMLLEPVERRLLDIGITGDVRYTDAGHVRCTDCSVVMLLEPVSVGCLPSIASLTSA
jgi:hypothetical protein